MADVATFGPMVIGQNPLMKDLDVRASIVRRWNRTPFIAAGGAALGTYGIAKRQTWAMVVGGGVFAYAAWQWWQIKLQLRAMDAERSAAEQNAGAYAQIVKGSGQPGIINGADDAAPGSAAGASMNGLG